ncbi:hypothetical protein USB125703_01199 [Pseudoclavibacter triregionum]|nr:hypothetical protein USB125703_01199 [Pseudoclavibacter triregionum]
MTRDGHARAGGAGRALARGWSAAAIAVVPAAASHGIAGGHAVAPIVLLVALVLAAAVCVPLVGRSLSRVRLVAAVLASQAGLHLLYACGAGASAAVDGPMGGHVHGPGLAPEAAGAIAAAAGHAAPVDGPMLVAHLVAAVVTVAGLLRAERLAAALVRAAEGLAAAIARLAEVVPALPISARAARPAAAPAVLVRRAPSADPARGPPSGLPLR